MSNNAKKEEVDINSGVDRPAWTYMDNNRISSLQHILKPLLYGLAVAGCFNFADIDCYTGRTGLKLFFSRLYRTAVLLVLLLLIVKFVASFFTLPSTDLYLNGICLLWVMFVLCIFGIQVKANSCRFRHLQRAFKLWDQHIAQGFSDLGIPVPASTFRKRSVVMVTVASVVATINSVGFGMQYFMGKGYFYSAPFQLDPYIFSVLIILMSVADVVWIFPLAFTIALTKIIKELFITLNTYGETECQKSGCTISPKFQQIRVLHLDLSKLVRDLDQDIGWYHGANFAFNIGLELFIVYQMIRVKMDLLLLGMFCIWLLYGFLYITAAAISATLLHDAVSRIL
jgi:hypothetical protein